MQIFSFSPTSCQCFSHLLNGYNEVHGCTSTAVCGCFIGIICVTLVVMAFVYFLSGILVSCFSTLGIGSFCVALSLGDSEVQRTMLELLNQLDGFEPKQNIKVRVLMAFSE